MPRYRNNELISRIIRTTIGVIGRRTSESYAVMVIGTVVKRLSEKYDFLKNVEISNAQYSEIGQIVNIKNDLDYVNIEEIGRASRDFIQKITIALGKNAGYFFIKEIKEDLPYEYEQTIKQLGVDLDFLQLEYLTDRKSVFDFQIPHSELLTYVFQALFDVLAKENGRNFAFLTLEELVRRFSTKYEILKDIEVNDIRYMMGANIVSIDSKVDVLESDVIGDVTQKVIQETSNYLQEKGGIPFIEKLKKYMGVEYYLKLEEMGVNLGAIHMKHGVIVKRVLKALVDILSEASAESYAILVLDRTLSRIYYDYELLRFIEIDSSRYSEGFDAVCISSDIDLVSPSEVGRGIQKLIEKISSSLGEDAGQNFVERLKFRLGKAYVLKMEELGVNLHLVKLREDLVF
jgi:hypothetical protein